MKILPSGAKISRATLKPLTRASETKMSSTPVRVLAPSKRPRASTDVPASAWDTARVLWHLLAPVGLQVREVDQPILGEPRMHGHVPQTQPAAVGVVHLGHAADGLGIEHAVADDPQTARALRDQDVAVRQEVHGRRTEEALDGDDTEPLIAEAQDLRLVGQGVRADPPASLLRVADGDEQAHREDDEEHGRPSRRACERHGVPPTRTEPVPAARGSPPRHAAIIGQDGERRPDGASIVGPDTVRERFLPSRSTRTRR